MYYTIKEAKKSKLITRYLVSTDDKEIQAIAKKYGAEAPFLRPKNLSGDKASAAKADLHALKWAEKNEGKSEEKAMKKAEEAARLAAAEEEARKKAEEAARLAAAEEEAREKAEAAARLAAAKEEAARLAVVE